MIQMNYIIIIKLRENIFEAPGPLLGPPSANFIFSENTRLIQVQNLLFEKHILEPPNLSFMISNDQTWLD